LAFISTNLQFTAVDEYLVTFTVLSVCA
jgi:hypothetical protein